MRFRKLLLLIPVLIIVLLAGCDKELLALRDMHRLAVLLPDNYTDCPDLPDEIKAYVLGHMPAYFAVEFIDGAALEAQLPNNGIETALNDPALAAELGQRFGVDGFIVGSASHYKKYYRPRFKLSFSTESPPQANLSLDAGVEVGFNLKLIRAADASSYFYRQAARSASEVISFGPDQLSVTIELFVEPYFEEMRQEAVHEAVHDMINQIRREVKNAGA